MASRPTDLSPREARERFLDDRRMDSTDHTIQSYHYRLKMFCQWCDERDITSVSSIDGWTLDEYRRSLQQDHAPVTVKGKLTAVKQLLDYCARIEVVDDDLPEKVHIPEVSREEETSDVKLAADDATSLLSFYRDSPAFSGTVKHACLELLWNTGCRLSGLRALDRGDYHPDAQFVEFVHRPQTGTGLKNKADGERAVGLPESVCDVLDHYIARDRHDKRDDHGREPLLTSRQGRPSESTIRCWTYQATQPCVYVDCPHGKRRATCDWTERSASSKCPSSRSPHQVRTGSITWHRDRGVPLEVTSERVNASPKVIERFYDKATERQKMENRRREHLTDLDVEEDSL